MNYITLLLFYFFLFCAGYAQAAPEEPLTVLSYPSKSTGSLPTIVGKMDDYAKTLQEISIIGRFQEDMSAVLERFSGCLSLTFLDLSICDLDNQKVMLLLSQLPGTLITLILDGNPIDDEILGGLEAWINNRPSIETVRLAGTRIGPYATDHPKIQREIPNDGQPILPSIYPEVPEGYGQDL